MSDRYNKEHAPHAPVLREHSEAERAAFVSNMLGKIEQPLITKLERENEALRAQVAGLRELLSELMETQFPDATADEPGDVYSRLRAALAETPR